MSDAGDTNDTGNHFSGDHHIHVTTFDSDYPASTSKTESAVHTTQVASTDRDSENIGAKHVDLTTTCGEDWDEYQRRVYYNAAYDPHTSGIAPAECPLCCQKLCAPFAEVGLYVLGALLFLIGFAAIFTRNN